MKLKGKVCLVTGGGVRVGKALSLALASRGAKVAIHYRRSKASAERVAASIRKKKGRAITVQADLTETAEIDRMVREVTGSLGPVDVLLNSASEFHRTPFSKLTEADWDRHLDANLKGPFWLCRKVGPGMKRRGGVILNIADWSGERPYRDYLPYCVSKAGLIALTKGLAKELAPKVRVCAIGPGPVLPPEDFTAAERKQLEKRTLLNRLGKADDVANCALFLIEGTDFATGSLHLVDGGRLIF